MSVDKNFIGYEFPPVTLPVEEGRLRFFAKAIGETGEINTDKEAAIEAGYGSVVAPPTFGFALELERKNPFDIMEFLNIDMGKVLHANQSFDYYAPIVAGDKITVKRKITDIFDKKGGALTFVEWETTFINGSGNCVTKA